LNFEKFFWRTIFILYIILIFYVSLSHPVISVSNFKGEDKIVHFIMYFIGADLFCLSMRGLKSKILKFLLYLSFFSIPVLTEYLQYRLPYRTFSWGDVIANFSGLTIGILFYVIKIVAFKEKKEHSCNKKR